MGLVPPPCAARRPLSMTSEVMAHGRPLCHGGTVTSTVQPVGEILRSWRRRRGRSQLDLSLATGVSARHVSRMETGLARPSRAMIERICTALEVPLRERNRAHLAAGFAPQHTEHAPSDLGAVTVALESLLHAHEPYPAVAIDVCWDVVAANAAMHRFLGLIPEAVAGPPLNMLRATLHPDGLLAHLRNPEQWRANALRRVRRQLDRTADPRLRDLLTELRSYPGSDTDREPPVAEEIVVPMRMTIDGADLALLYTVTVFGAPRDITVDEIAIETFLPADDATRELLVTMAATAAATSPAAGSIVSLSPAT